MCYSEQSAGVVCGCPLISMSRAKRKPDFLIVSVSILIALLVFTYPFQSVHAANGSTTIVSSPSAVRCGASATLMPNGQVLLTGGRSATTPLASAEIFDPTTDSWSEAESMGVSRYFHSSLLLPNGKILVVGGTTPTNAYSPPQVYDPAANTWSDVALPGYNGNLWATVTLLQNGNVLFVGGDVSPKLYDPVSNTWSSAGSPLFNPSLNTATLLPNGKVLIAGGSLGGGEAQLYDPVTNSWSAAKSMINGRRFHIATLLRNGRVLVQGGSGSSGTVVTAAEQYDPDTDSWSPAGTNPLSTRRSTATLLPNGKVVVTGGGDDSCVNSDQPSSRSIMVYDPASNVWTRDVDLQLDRSNHTATLLPDGRVLVVGTCTCDNTPATFDLGEIYTPTSSSNWSSRGNLITPRSEHAAVILPNATTLVVGGISNGSYLHTAELFDPATLTWSGTGRLSTARSAHTATLMNGGKVLVAGGFDGTNSLASAELFDPQSGIWSMTGSLSQGRKGHTATLLQNGDVLAVGGFSGISALKTTEVYSLATGNWKSLPNLNVARANHTATLLEDGKILVAGGYDGVNYLASVELYDPVANKWSIIDSLGKARAFHTATLVSGGSVLIAGGNDATSAIGLAELFDEEDESWASLDSIGPSARTGHTTTLLSNGSVLFAGGAASGNCVASADIYAPVTDLWSRAGGLLAPRRGHTATLQPDGTVLVVGGYEGITGSLASCEAYNANTGITSDQRPVPTNMSMSAGQANLTIVGSGFRGVSEGSSGTANNSSTGFPLVQLKRVDNDQSFFLLSDPGQSWSGTQFTSRSLAELFLPAGYYRATVFTSAIPSVSQFVQIDATVSQSPALGISPVPVDFGMVNGSSTKTVTIANKGYADLILSSISLLGANAEQFISAPAGSCWAGIVPGASCLVDVTFTPNSSTPVQAVLNVLSNDPHNTSYDIPLTGSGVSPSVTLTINIAGPGTGSVTAAPAPPGIACTVTCSQTFLSGTTVTLTPSANTGSTFAGWTGCDSVNGGICSVAMTGSRNVTAGFSDLAITTTTLSDGSVGTAYSQTLMAGGGRSPFSWSVAGGSLPAGLNLDSTTGMITGSPTGTGTSTFTVQVVDANAATLTKTLTITVYAALSVSTANLPAATTGTAYSQTLTAAGGQAPYTWSITSGTLPSGLSLNGATGAITGTTVKSGTYNFTVQVSDAYSVKATKSLSIVSNAGTLAVLTATPATGYLNVPYSQVLEAKGGNAPFTWSITTGTLLTGLTLNAASGTISGTPTTSGAKTFTVQVKDASSKTAKKSLTLTVNAALAVSTASLTTGNVGTPYSQTLAATGGKTPYIWSITVGSLPAGLVLDAATGAITGTPTNSGSSSFTVQAKDANNTSATKALSITINATVLTVSTTSLSKGYVGVAYSQALDASNGKTPYSWTKTAGTLPAGITLSTAGILSGTPTTAVSNSSLTFKVKDANNATATKVLPITINAAPSVSTASLAAGNVGTPYNQILAATGGKTPYIWSITVGSLPAGLVLDAATGAITGTPTTAGSSSFTVQAKDANNTTATKALSITINPAVLAITTSSLVNGFIDTNYYQTLAAIGGKAPYTWSISSGSLPQVLSLQASTGIISGAPSVAGLSTITFKVRDAGNATATRALTIAIYDVPTITTESLPMGTVDSPYTGYLAASGGKPPYSWSFVGDSLLPGLNLDPVTGTITGTPTAAASYYPAIQVKDANNAVQIRHFTLTINPVLKVTTEAVTHGYVGSPFRYVLSAGGGTAPYTWSVTVGTLLAGLRLESSGTGYGTVSGTPTTPGTKTVTVQVMDSAGHSASQSLTFDVYASPVIETSSLPESRVGSTYSQTLTASGGKTPYTWSLSSGSLPAGLALNAGTGAITGKPTGTGNSIFTAKVTDANARGYTKTFSINVSPAIARIAASPSTVSFGGVFMGKTATALLTISNSGDSDTAIGAIQPPAASFSFISDGCSGKTLSVGSSCTINLSFSPLHAGPYTDTLNVPSSDEYYPVISVGLGGYGIFDYLVPDTGRGEFVRNPLLYTSSSSLTAVDENTLLAWQREGSNAKMTWADADTYCRNLSLDGTTGWRLPNYIELTGIIHYGATNPAIDRSTFTGVRADAYWTSSQDLAVINGTPIPTAKTVSFAYGEATTTDKTTTAYALCTRGEELVNAVITTGNPNDPGSQATYIDQAGGLVWIKTEVDASSVTICPFGNTCHQATWDDAALICKSLSYAGFSDWRLPTIKELATLSVAHSWSLTSSDKPDALGQLSQVYAYSSGTIVAVTKSNDIGDYGLRCVRGGNNPKIHSLGDTGNVTVMEITGNFDLTNADVTLNDLQRKVVAKEYLKNHEDQDFLVILSTFDYALPEAGAQGFFLGVKNDTQGINRPLFDNTSQFGSAGRLQGIIDMGNVTALAAAPYGAALEKFLTVLLQETGHQWLSYVRFKNPDGTLNTGLLGKDSTHWSWLLDSKGSVMYGNGWKDNGDGSFTSTTTMSGFSPLDLYLMGMIPKEQVPPMLLIENSGIDKNQLPVLGATVTGTQKLVTIDDIIAAEGARIPDAASSPKQFKVGFVLMSRPGDNTAAAVQAIDALRTAFAGRFAELTGGKGVVPSVKVVIESPADGAAITRPDVVVSGMVYNSTDAETGVTVNGMPAVVTGNHFILNHVPLSEGTNSISVSATDVSGLTATATTSITATPGHYLRIVPSTESGVAPLDVSLILDGSFSIENSQISVSGPEAVAQESGERENSYKLKFVMEGTYTVTGSAVGPDGQTYSDTIAIIVISKEKLDALLRAKWEAMRTALAAGDIATAVSKFSKYSKDSYLQQFTDLSASLPEVATGMANITMVKVDGNVAEYDLRDTIDGVTYSFYLLFVKDLDGLWKIWNF